MKIQAWAEIFALLLLATKVVAGERGGTPAVAGAQASETAEAAVPDSPDEHPCTGLGTVSIGCSIGCNGPFQRRLGEAAHRLGVRVSFVNLMEAAGARGGNVKAALDSVDGILSPGGKDINPNYYLGALPEEAREKLLADYRRLAHRDAFTTQQRDPFESALYTEYFNNDQYRDMPALGVCYGMQMMSVTNGLPLVVDLHERYGIPNRYDVHETVMLEPGSRASHIWPALPSIEGFEEHHQAVDYEAYMHTVSPRAHVVATSRHGPGGEVRIPEVVEFDGRPAIATQFHPEVRGTPASVSRPLFDWFVENACRNKLRKAVRVVDDVQHASAQLAGPQSCDQQQPAPPHGLWAWVRHVLHRD